MGSDGPGRARQSVIDPRRSAISRILLVRLRQIGDVVFTTPAVHALRQRFPDACLTYVVEPAAAAVVATNPHIDEIVVAPRTGGFRQLRADVALGRRLRRRRFDLAIDFHGGPRSSLLTWLSGAPVRVGYAVAGRSWMYTRRVARPRELRPRHSVENQWDLLGALGMEPPDRSAMPVEMPVDPTAAARVDARLSAAGVTAADRIVVIHVSAGNPFRRWPVEAFAEVAAVLAAADAARRIVVTSGPSDAGAAIRVVEAARIRAGEGVARRVLSTGEFGLDELRALVERAALFVGGDSGPLHVASTSPVPIVGLYGPTLPVRSAPWRAPELVAEAVEVGPLPCRPCEQRVCAPGDFRCLTAIRPEAVTAAAERALARAHRGAGAL